MTRTKNPYVPSAELASSVAKLGKPLVYTHVEKRKLEQKKYDDSTDAFRTGRVTDYFWSRVGRAEGDPALACWPWQLSLQNGYGRVMIHGRMMYAHRVAAILAGILSDPYDPHLLKQTCGNKSCCRPAHIIKLNPTPLAMQPLLPQAPIARGMPGGPQIKRRRGPNKRKSLPVGWVNPLYQNRLLNQLKNPNTPAAKSNNDATSNTNDAASPYDPFKP